jgi:tetratricopeptide (TPR) repeat protein
VKRLILALVLMGAGLAFAYGLFETRREQTYRSLINRGEAALAAGDTFGAIEEFSGAVALRPHAMLGYLRRGEAYWQRREHQAALRDLVRASEIDRTATRPRELRGDVESALLRYDRAAASYRAFLALDDQSPRLLYKLAVAEYHQGHADEALRALDRAAALDGGSAEAHYLRGLLLVAQNARTRAIPELLHAVQLAPSMIAAREELARLYGTLGRHESQIQQLEALLALDDRPGRAVAVALAYQRRGSIERAVLTLRDAAARFPGSAEIPAALGQLWLDQAAAEGDDVAKQKARAALESAAAAAPTSRTLALLGRTLLLQGDLARAERVLEDAASRRPVDPDALLCLADAAQRARHPQIARRALLDYHALAGEDAEPRRRAATAARIAGLSWDLDDMAAAAEWYGRAAGDGSSDPVVLTRLAEARRRIAAPTASGAASGAPGQEPGSLLARRPERLVR